MSMYIYSKVSVNDIVGSRALKAMAKTRICRPQCYHLLYLIKMCRSQTRIYTCVHTECDIFDHCRDFPDCEQTNEPEAAYPDSACLECFTEEMEAEEAKIRAGYRALARARAHEKFRRGILDWLEGIKSHRHLWDRFRRPEDERPPEKEVKPGPGGHCGM